MCAVTGEEGAWCKVAELMVGKEVERAEPVGND